MENNKKRAIRGVFWSAIERFSVQGIQFVVSVILARILMPADFGLIALVLVVINILNTINETGFGAALMQKLDRDQLDFSTVFVMNIILGLLLYSILFLLSPNLASFFNEPQLSKLLRILGLGLIINSFVVVQRTQLWIKVDYKTLSKASLVAVIVSGSIGIYCALRDFGVMALVIQSLINSTLTTLGIWFYGKWKPNFTFSLTRFKQLFRYAYKLIVARLINSIFQEAYSGIIVKIYTPADLGFFNRAKSFVAISSINIINVVQRVSIPLFCETQNDHKQFENQLIKFIVSTAFIVYPLLFGIVVLAQPIISVLLTDKWLPAVPILQILCVSSFFSLISNFNMNVFNATGRTDLALKAEIIKKIFFFIIVVIALTRNFMALIFGQVVIAFMEFCVNAYYTKKQIGVSPLKQFLVLKGVLTSSLIMSVSVFVLVSFIDDNLTKLIVGFIAGLLVYLIISYIFNIADSKLYLKNFSSKFFSKK